MCIPGIVCRDQTYQGHTVNRWPTLPSLVSNDLTEAYAELPAVLSATMDVISPKITVIQNAYGMPEDMQVVVTALLPQT